MISASSSRLASSPLRLSSTLARQAAKVLRPLPTQLQHPQHRSYTQPAIQVDSGQPGLNDLILSILQSNPSIRDTRHYLCDFGPRTPAAPSAAAAVSVEKTPLVPASITAQAPTNISAIPQQRSTDDTTATDRQAVINTFLNPIQRRTALVKIQGPFTDIQLESICRGLVYLEQLGLVSIIVVTRDNWHPGQEREMEEAKEDAMRVTLELERQGARARPVLDPIVKLGPKPPNKASGQPDSQMTKNDPASPSAPAEEVNAHALPTDLVPIQSALRAGEIPVLSPLALDSFCRTIRVSANDVIGGLAKAMVEVGSSPLQPWIKRDAKSVLETYAEDSSEISPEGEVDLTPLRLMVINREGGLPSYARSGLPHLLVNLSSEHDYIRSTFDPDWVASHPTSMANLDLAKTCLSYMPPSSSAIIVSHRSPRSLIANLVTNKPALSSSLPEHLLNSGPKKITPHTPTLIRLGLPIRVIQKHNIHELDKDKLNHLMEQSFKRTLVADEFYERLDKVLSFVIVAGDYAGAAIVTEEPIPNPRPGGPRTMCYLDKFAVHPSHQGDGTVDFLWVALHDESFGLGLDHAANPNQGGQMGIGQGRDLVWRSRTDNPANKWYFERSSGHLRIPPTKPGDQSWTMFWCDAEDRLEQRGKEILATPGVPEWKWQIGANGKRERGISGLSFVEEPEKGRIDEWSEVVAKIPASWVPLPKKTK